MREWPPRGNLMTVKHLSPSIRRLIGIASWLVLSAVIAASQAVQSGPSRDASGELKALAKQSLAQVEGALAVPGLREPVEIVRDRWGVPHIYARNTDDLFFAQGYVMGQDRLWQMEMWRRQREGRLSEILGPETFERDRQARLLMYPRSVRRSRVDELSPRRQTHLHGVRERTERLHLTARPRPNEAPGRIQADRDRAVVVDTGNRVAAHCDARRRGSRAAARATGRARRRARGQSAADAGPVG